MIIYLALKLNTIKTYCWIYGWSVWQFLLPFTLLLIVII